MEIKKEYLSLLLVLFFGFFLLEAHTIYKTQLANIFSVSFLYDYQNSKGVKRELAMSDKGKDVQHVQEFLSGIDSNFSKDNITGYFGPITKDAVGKYQLSNDLVVTERVDAQTRESMNKLILEELCPVKKDEYYKNPILVKVNKKARLPKDYIPSNLVVVPESIKTTKIVCFKKDALPYLEKMIQDAKKQNLNIAITSGFRKEEMQSFIYKIWESVMKEETPNEVAYPGYSEHQLGYAVDLTGFNNQYQSVDPQFENTPEFKWLTENAHKYGFVMSYTKDTKHITGYNYEPWHWRFVGLAPAKEIFKKKIIPQEYINSLK